MGSKRINNRSLLIMLQLIPHASPTKSNNRVNDGSSGSGWVVVGCGWVGGGGGAPGGGTVAPGGVNMPAQRIPSSMRIQAANICCMGLQMATHMQDYMCKVLHDVSAKNVLNGGGQVPLQFGASLLCITVNE